MNQKEKEFFKILETIFIGAKIVGNPASGFINLMKIKSSYFECVFDNLTNEISEKTKNFPEFKEEIFDKLYSFFKTYFSESGSIYFSYTPLKSNVYERVYTNQKDIALFWKTHMLYYVKTDKLWNNLTIDFDNNGISYKIHFDVSKLEHKKANEKKEIIYELTNIDGKEITFNVLYSERGKVTKTDEILKEFKKKNIFPDEENLNKIFRIFEKQNEVDYFINKNAEQFLKEHFNLWLKSYLLDDESDYSEKRLKQLKVLKEIAYAIIDFVAQFEDELVKIWNKPKFVRKSNYVITLDRITDKKLVEKILKHIGIKEQIKEWQEIGIVDENFKAGDIFENSLEGKYLNKKYEHLPIDTKYFKDLEFEILSLFDDLDNQLDGWLIKSENYQALNTILPKFKERVQTIYIDPPFNLDSSDQFLYRTNYKDANWATLLENRLKLAKDILNKKGSIFVRCDYNGNWIVRCLMDEIFDVQNYLNEFIIRRITKKGFNANRYPTSSDYIYWYSKADKLFFNIIRLPKEIEKEKWHSMDSMSGGRGTGEARYILGKLMMPPKNRVWTFSQERIYEMEKQGLIKLNSMGTPIYKVLSQEGEPLDSNWSDIQGYSFTTEFATENSEKLLDRVINTGSQNNDLILDFFLGSGTTTAVAHKLKRKWIGVEMGEHFYSVVLPRMKKVLAYDKSGISKEVKDYQGGGFFKYYELEQYEDTLRRVIYKDSHPFVDFSDKTTIYSQYVFLNDLKMSDAIELDYKNNKIKIDFSKIYPDIDLAETISLVSGKKIKKMEKDGVIIEKDKGTTEKINFDNIPFNLIRPLIWWTK